MCGIVGRVAWSGPIDRSLLIRQSDALLHRGPDEGGLWVEGPVGLAMRRLKVVDLVGGQQPMDNRECPCHSLRGTLRLVFNGEIYNTPTLKPELLARGHKFKSHSDTEVLLHALEEWGDNAWNKLNGMFAVAVYDERAHRLTLARDRHGIKPLYYNLGPDGVRFASEIKALLLDPALSREKDPSAVDAYFSLGYVPTPLSIYKSISKLPPGSALSIDVASRSPRLMPFAGFEPRSAPLGRAEWMEGLDDRLAAAVARQMVSDVPIGVSLSGGLDSSAIASYVNRLGRPLDSFHVYFASPSYSEREEAGRTANRLGLRHHEWEMPTPPPDEVERVVGLFDEPLSDPSVLPTEFLFRKTREHVTVTLSGDGGDEIFAGYPTYLADRWARWYRRLPVAAQNLLRRMGTALPVSFQRISWDFKLKSFLAAAGRPQPLAHLGWQELFTAEEKYSRSAVDGKPPAFAGDSGNTLFNRSFIPGANPVESFHRAYQESGGIDHLTAWMWLDRRTHLMDRFLVKVDRLSMAHSLEVRVPMLDNEVVDWSARIPDSDQLGLFTTKRSLRSLMKDRLPSNVVRGSKKGFAPPLAEWLAGPLYSWAASVLSPAQLRRTEFLNAEAPRVWLAEHRSKHRDHSRRLWTLMNYVLWLGA
ncbi:MAG: asparagine synthase (glutamine-hydrolyzing) [Elusimicrobia bacterium]|nr:asparagine synthase (glutamine-hydrolyzing) [Elusimicrobiota bacterium]